MIDRFKSCGILLGLSTSHLERVNRSVIDGRVKDKYRVPNRDAKEFIYLITNSDNNKVILEGNLRKYWYGSINAMNDFNYKNYCECMKFIASVIRVETKEIWFLKLKRIEIGGNIKLKRKYADIISAMKRYPRLVRVTYKKGTTKFVGTKKYVIAYDKLVEILNDKRCRISKKNKEKILKTNFVLRFEISFSGLHNSGLKEELSTFYTIRQNWNTILQFWVDSFEKIEIEDDLGDVRKIERKSLNLTEIKEILIYQAIKSKSLTDVYDFVNIYAKSHSWEYRKAFLKIVRKCKPEVNRYLKMEVQQKLLSKASLLSK